MSRSRSYAFAPVAIVGALAVPAPAAAAVINDLFVFGDSYSDTGAYAKATNGKTAVEYLAENFGITLTTSKNPDPGKDGVNFAESGARVFVGPAPPARIPEALPSRSPNFRITSRRPR